MSVDVKDRQLPIPEDFPVEWEDPADAERFFERENQHFPGQLRVLEYSLLKRLFAYGFNGGCEHYGLPVRNTFRLYNTYAYQAIGPISHEPNIPATGTGPSACSRYAASRPGTPSEPETLTTRVCPSPLAATP